MTLLHPPKHIVAVSACVRNSLEQVLLLQSPKRGWEFPGGQVEEGETLIQALERETLEETGITIRVGSLVGVYSNIKLPSKVMFGFLATYIGGECCTSSERLQVEWVDEAEVLQRITHPAIHDRIRDMLHFDGQVVYRVYTTEPYHVLTDTIL